MPTEQICVLSETHSLKVDGRDVGYCKGELVFELTVETVPIEVDQISATLYSVPTKTSIKVVATLAEASLENLKLAWNLPSDIVPDPPARKLKGGIVTTVPVHTLEFFGEFYQEDGSRVTRQIICFKAQNFGTVETKYKKGEMTLVVIEFFLLPDTTKPSGEEFFEIREIR